MIPMRFGCEENPKNTFDIQKEVDQQTKEVQQQNHYVCSDQIENVGQEYHDQIHSAMTECSPNQMVFSFKSNDDLKQQKNFEELQFQSAGCMLPHPKLNSKESKLSSDFFKVTSRICGVTDGVSQWKKYSINPRKFAQQLLEKTTQGFYKYYEDLKTQNLLNIPNIVSNLGRQAIQSSFNESTAPGSCTIITYYLIQDQLHIDVIGDSLLIVIRPKKSKKYELIYAAKPKQYEFNKPYQLIKVPNQENQEKMISKMKSNKVKEFQSLIAQFQKAKFVQACDSNHSIVKIQPDDLIICGSDGFFDNLYCQDIIQLIYEHRECSLEELCFILCINAWKASQNEEYESPFAEQNLKKVNFWEGGKEDDVTVLISKIVSTT